MQFDDERSVWIGCGVGVGATIVLTVFAAAMESTINGPGSRTVAPPVLWAVGGGLGLCVGAVVTSWSTRRVLPGVFAAAIATIPFLALVILAYNDDELRFGDQLVGSLVVVVLPGLVAAALLASIAAYASRLLGARHPAPRKSVTT